MMMSIIRSMIKTRRCFSRKQKFRERDEKTNKFFSSSSSSSVVLRRRRSTTNNERRQTDRQILSSLSLSLSFFRLQMRGRKEEVKKTNAKLLFARSRRFLFSKFVRAQSVRILFCPVLSVVFALKDRRLSFRRRRM
jgi:hypothetical protein